MEPEAAILLAFLTGCIILLFGLLNFGFLIDFIAAPVVAGFTSAAAFTIATTQIESLLGLKYEVEGFLNTWITEYLIITPDRSLVRKASSLYPGIIVVIDMHHVSAADFTTVYGFDNMIKSLKKHEHKIVLTRTMPEILPILSGIGCDLHIHSEGMDLELFIKEVATSPSEPALISSDSSSTLSSTTGTNTTVKRNSKIEETSMTSISINVEKDPQGKV
uniref:SLC26A/SulP transporter domain-containing protein n=1 Tax=Daphnia galeata TaxID=27404 RepID=A0A8J2RQJ0_9CRUS|nr:unnamed protein product [Daphnia galeata]